MASKQQTVSLLNDLLQGEISAVETYVQALEKFSDEPEVHELDRLKAEHIEACNILRRFVHSEEGAPETSSGVWGTWAKAVEGTAKTFGKKAALKALKEGEEHGLRTYEDTLSLTDIDPRLKEIIQSRFLPAGSEHIRALDQLMHLEDTTDD